MKFLILLTFIPFLAYGRVGPATCDPKAAPPANSSPEQQKIFYCEMNLRCTVNALNTTKINWDEVDSRRAYSMKNKCNDELRLAAMMQEMAKDPPELHVNSEPEINQSERSEGKELPMIPDAPKRSSSRVKEQ